MDVWITEQDLPGLPYTASRDNIETAIRRWETIAPPGMPRIRIAGAILPEATDTLDEYKNYFRSPSRARGLYFLNDLQGQIMAAVYGGPPDHISAVSSFFTLGTRLHSAVVVTSAVGLKNIPFNLNSHFHEFGHALGISNTLVHAIDQIPLVRAEDFAVMYPVIPAQTERRFQPNDEGWLDWLYARPRRLGTIVGRVALANGQPGIGLNVVAIPTEDALRSGSSSARFSGSSDTYGANTGEFIIPARSGSYDLWAQTPVVLGSPGQADLLPQHFMPLLMQRISTPDGIGLEKVEPKPTYGVRWQRIGGPFQVQAGKPTAIGTPLAVQ